MKNTLIITVSLVLGLAASTHAQQPVDLVLHNAKIFTADQLLSTYSAVAVDDGRIVALGWGDIMERYRGARTIDAGGRLVIPGFIDAPHPHER